MPGIRIKNYKVNQLKLFLGRKTQWLPLYQRFLARVHSLDGIEIVSHLHSISLCKQGHDRLVFGKVRVLQKGIEIGLDLGRLKVPTSRLVIYSGKSKGITHLLTLKKVSEIDEEIISLIKFASQQGYTSKARSF